MLVKPPRFRQLPHPADIRLAVWGNNREELLRNGVLGAMYTAMDVELPLAPASWHRVPEWPASLEGRLVAAVNEALFLLYTRRQMTVALRRHDREVELGAAPLPPGSTPAREIKAATFHGLSTGRSAGRLRAIILLDL